MIRISSRTRARPIASPETIPRGLLAHRTLHALPNPDKSHATYKLLFLVLNRSEKEWKMPPREEAMAKAQVAVIFGERFTRAMAG